MYRLGQPTRRHYWLYALAVVLIAGLLGGGFVLGRQLLQANTRLTQSKPYIGYVPASSTPLQHISKNLFTLDLPNTWKPAPPPPVAYTVYSWQGTRDDSTRRLDIYVDTIPNTMAVNRLLPVQADGAQVAVIGQVSDNCVNFTDHSPASATSGIAAAKWDGVSFWCDVGNYERDVVGTGSAEGANAVTLTGPATGNHRFFFVYTDNSANPDYTIFQSAIQSFRLR